MFYIEKGKNNCAFYRNKVVGCIKGPESGQVYLQV